MPRNNWAIQRKGIIVKDEYEVASVWNTYRLNVETFVLEFDLKNIDSLTFQARVSFEQIVNRAHERL